MSTGRKLRVLMVPTSNSGVVFWRMQNFARAAHRTGAADVHLLWWQKKLTHTHPWEVEIADPAFKLRIFKEMYQWAQQSDVVVFQTVHNHAALGAFYTLKDIFPDKPILAECDDDILNTPAYNPAFDAFDAAGTEFRAAALAQFRAADGIVVSTPYLGELYADFNERSYVVHNAIDFWKWGRLRRTSGKEVRIGWAGGMNHDDDLRIIEPVIRAIQARDRGVKFVFVHGAPESIRALPGVEYDPRSVAVEAYPQFLADHAIDIGIAPLLDNSFNRGKSNLRWLEYSALGLPTVASRVGHFRETIRDGIDGLLADDAAGFERHLQAIIDDRRRRLELGQAALARVKQDFDVDQVVGHYVACLERALEVGRVNDPPPVRAFDDDDIRPLDPLPAGTEAEDLPAQEVLQ